MFLETLHYNEYLHGHLIFDRADRNSGKNSNVRFRKLRMALNSPQTEEHWEQMTTSRCFAFTRKKLVLYV